MLWLAAHANESYSGVQKMSVSMFLFCTLSKEEKKGIFCEYGEEYKMDKPCSLLALCSPRSSKVAKIRRGFPFRVQHFEIGNVHQGKKNVFLSNQTM